MDTFPSAQTKKNTRLVPLPLIDKPLVPDPSIVMAPLG